ncbi:calcium-binding protein [Mesorhizobium sp. CAU 1741]|uniref:calcium-binding protein n=1 Tax=Mesorhizobium sp. CAU 1741 TaxID=3140366 RepID=UPI00325B7338
MSRHYSSIIRKFLSFATTDTTTMTSQGALAVNVTVSADAFGEDTLADATLNITIIDRGLASFAFGTTTVLAAAQSPDPGSAYAITSTSVDIVGAEFIRTDQVAGSTWDDYAMADMQAVEFQAIDTHFFSALAVNSGSASAGDPQIGNISGNLATFEADISAEGDDTFVELLTDAIAVEDSFSSTVLSGTAAAETYVTYEMATGSKKLDLIITDDRTTLVKARAGTDLVWTGKGDDWIFGNKGKDLLDSGKGDDTVFGGRDADFIRGGAGGDWLFGGAGNDKSYGGDGNDLMFGDAGDDLLSGDGGDDLLVGGAGRDTLLGGAGNDFFRLGSNRGDGNDSHRGGKGADTYAIVDDFGKDTILDFSLGEGDRLLLPSLFEVAREDGLEPFDMRRAGGNDLVIEFEYLEGRSILTLDDFFKLNAGYFGSIAKGELSSGQVDQVLDAIADTISSDPASVGVLDLLSLADQVTLLG